MGTRYSGMSFMAGLGMRGVSRTRFENELNEKQIFLYSFLGIKKLIKIIVSNTNYLGYFKNNKKYGDFKNKRVNTNAHLIDIVDVLEQKENKSSKKSISYDDIDNGIKDKLVSSYGNPENELLKKLSRFYSAKYARIIKNDKKYNRLKRIENDINNKVKLSDSDVDFIYYFKKRHNIETLSTKEVFYIMNNY